MNLPSTLLTIMRADGEADLRVHRVDGPGACGEPGIPVRVSVAVATLRSPGWLIAQQLSLRQNDVKRSTIPDILGPWTHPAPGGSRPTNRSRGAPLGACRAFYAAIDAQLQRDTGIPLAYYEILVQLSEAPERALADDPAAAEAASASKSRVSHAVARLEDKG